jgi:hypothetical protein
LDQPALSKKAKIYRRVGKIIGRGLKKGRRLLNWDRETSKGIKKKSLLLINNTDMLVSLFQVFKYYFSLLTVPFSCP